MTSRILRTTSLFLTALSLSISAAVVDPGLLQPQTGSCVLKIETLNAVAVRLKPLGDRVQSPIFLSGISAVETLKITAGATLSPNFSDLILDDPRWLPEVKQRMTSRPEFSLGIPRPCADPTIDQYRRMLLADPAITNVRERIYPRITSELLPPPKRQAPNDPIFGKQYQLDCSNQTITLESRTIVCKEEPDIKYLVGASQSGGNNRVRLFIIDGGIDETHPDLPLRKINRALSINLTSKNELQKYDIKDELGHGSHVTGICCADTDNNSFIAGVADSEDIDEIVVVKVFADSGLTTEEIVVAGVWWVYNAAERDRKFGKKVINLSTNSWGAYGEIPGLYEAVWANVNAGIPFIAAAVNAGRDNDIDSNAYPPQWAKRPEFFDKPLIIVAASDWNNQIADFSNYGWQTTSTIIPGVAIVSTVPEKGTLGSLERQLLLSGTSMSTPAMAAAVAKVLKREGQAAVNNLRFRVMASGDKYPQFLGKAPSRLNMYEFRMPDTQASKAISDAKLVNVTYNKAEFTFSAPLDFSSAALPRRAGLYLVRTSTQPITFENFRFGRPHLISPPQAAGLLERIVLTNIPPETETYAAITVLDKGGNYSFNVLPKFRTKQAHITWLEVGGSFNQNEWEVVPNSKKQEPNIWHLDNGGWVYGVKGRGNYDTSPEFPSNEGLLLSSWQTAPQNATLRIQSSRHLGGYAYDVTGKKTYQGNLLTVMVYRETGKIPPVVELASLEGKPGGEIDEVEINLSRFEGEKVRVGFYVKGTLPFTKMKGVTLTLVEMYGTRYDADEELPRFLNSGFEEGPMFDTPENWRLGFYSGTCEGLQPDEEAKQKCYSKYQQKTDFLGIRNDEGYQSPAALRIFNYTRDNTTFILAQSEPVAVKSRVWYEIFSQARISGESHIIIGYYKNDKEIWLAHQVKTSNSSWSWEEWAVPFFTPLGVEKIWVRYAVRGNPTATSGADIDDIRLRFRKKLFSAH